LQFDSQGVCTRLACGSLFYTRLLINLGGLFLFPTYDFSRAFYDPAKRNTGKISAKRSKNLCKILPENAKVWNFKEGYV
jgi:hypothetical protein